MPFLLCLLARACGEAGKITEGLKIVEQAMGISRSGARCYLAELLRTKGELLIRQNPQDDAAEGWIQEAITLARDEGTKSLELRAATSLARRQRAKGHYRDARDLLSPIYEWFTEGLNTRDLLDANELLIELR
jgi:predicted ATPase